MIIKWINKPHSAPFIETLAWIPVKAEDDYTGYCAWVWLRWIRIHRDGKIAFSSFGL